MREHEDKVRSSDQISRRDLGFPWKNQEMEASEFDFTPIIDTTFLLLLFFICTATFSIHEVKNIQIPKSKTTSRYKEEKLALSIDKNRRIYLIREEVSFQNLKNKLMEKVSSTRQQDIILAADHSLDYGFIVSVLDEIEGAGIKNVKLKLEKIEKK